MSIPPCPSHTKKRFKPDRPGYTAPLREAGSAPRLIVAEPRTGAPTVDRTLGVGDTYADGWTVASLSASRVTFRRDDVIRTFEVIPSHPPAPLPDLPSDLDPLSLVNITIAGRMASATPARLRPL